MKAHGTRTSYVDYKCRCNACVQANRVYQREWMRRDRKAKFGKADPAHHGLRGYQHYGCRCDICRQANTDYYRNFRRAQAGKVIFFGSGWKTARGSEPTGRLEGRLNV